VNGAQVGFRGQRRPRGPSKERGGWSTLEVALSVAVLVLAALGVLSCVTAGLAVDRESSDQIAAQNLARRLMDELLRVPFETMVASYDKTKVVTDDLEATLRVGPVAPAAGAPSLLRMTVTVRSVGQEFAIVSVTGLRADRRPPESAWCHEQPRAALAGGAGPRTAGTARRGAFLARTEGGITP
jgi:hypothetical protein